MRSPVGTGKALALATVLSTLVLAAAPNSGDAQLQPASATIVKAAGRAEVLRRGQAQWVPATVGSRLVEGDQVRVFSGGSSELSIPDGSTILVAENTRFVITKLDYDAQSRERNMVFHLVAGKVRADVSRLAVQLVRARQSNFTISTPVGVAAVRGTIIVSLFNPATGQAAFFVLPSPGQDPATAVARYVDFSGRSVTVPAGSFITQTGTAPPSAAVPISNLSAPAQQQLQTVVNTATANAPVLTAPVVTVVSPVQIQALLAATGIAATAPIVVTVAPVPLTPVPVATPGRDIAQSCASPPCP